MDYERYVMYVMPVPNPGAGTGGTGTHDWEAIWHASYDTDRPVANLIERQRIASNAKRDCSDG